MVKYCCSLISAVLLLFGVAFAQVPSMPGPGGTLLNAVAATATSTGFAISGYGVVTFGTTSTANASGTVAYQGSMDNVNWIQMTCWLTGTTTAATSTVASSSTASSLVTCNTDGVPLVRVVLSPWIAGSFTSVVGTSYMPRTK